MSEPQKLGDLVVIESLEGVATNFACFARAFENLRLFTTNERPRHERRIVTENLCTALELQNTRLQKWIDEPVDMIAWATRNIYELFLAARFVSASAENTEHWLVQRGRDEVEILEGTLQLSGDPDAPHTKRLRQMLQSLHDIEKKHGMDMDKAKPKAAFELAKMFDMKDEHAALFKLFSKYVHPSSWWVNASSERTGNGDSRNILWVSAQFYDARILKVLEDYIGRPQIAPPPTHHES